MASDLPPDDDALRRLLADARHTEPIPVDVAARLDDVLAQLGQEAEPVEEVADLHRRRRLRAVRLLAAAAAVIVVGTGAAQLLDLEGTGTDAASSDSAASSAQGADTGGDSGRSVAPEAAAGGSTADGQSDLSGGTTGGTAGDAPLAAEALPQALTVPSRFSRLSSDDFTGEVARLQVRLRSVQAYSGTQDRKLDRLEAEGCEPADWGPGEAVSVTYDGEPATLVFRPVTGSTQIVDLLQCGTADVLRSTTVRAG